MLLENALYIAKMEFLAWPAVSNFSAGRSFKSLHLQSCKQWCSK